MQGFFFDLTLGMKRVEFLLILLFGFISTFTAAQQLEYNHDTSNYRILLDDVLHSSSLSEVDTNLDEVHRYNLRFLDDLVGYTGSYGNASNAWAIDNTESIWLLGEQVNRLWQYKPADLDYFQVRKPFTRITYHNGPRREQEIEFIHTQNLNETSNVAVFYRRFNSDGFYQRQRSVQSNAGLNFNYASRSGRYRAKGYAIINIGYSQENGGMIFDSTFTENTEANRLGLATYLSEAENQYDTRYYGLEQYIILQTPDSNRALEVGLNIHSDYILEDLRYEDLNPVDSFYFQYHLPISGYVSDNIQLRSLKNSLGLRFSRNKFSVSPILRYNYHDLRNMSSDTLMSDVGVGFLFSLDTKLRVEASGNHYLEGYSAGTFRYDVKLSHHVSDSSDFKLAYQFLSESYLPAWEHVFYENSLEVRRNTWAPINSFSFGMKLTDDKKRSLGVSFRSIENYTFFDTSLVSNQFVDRVNILEAYTDYKLSFLKPVFIEARFKLRHVLDDSAPINLPLLQSSSTIYIEKPFFKKALYGRIGFDVYHFTSFYGDGYMPLGRRFYYQDRDETGGFVYLDAFLSLQIGRARGFVKLSNITSGLTPYNYILTPGHPLQDNGLRFGISWDLMN